MKLNKFKSLLAFLLVCGLTVSAASCGGETSTSDSSTQSSESVADSSSDSADSSSDSSAEQPGSRHYLCGRKEGQLHDGFGRESHVAFCDGGR